MIEDKKESSDEPVDEIVKSIAQNITPSLIPPLIQKKELLLLDLKGEVFDFLRTDHSAAAAKEMENKLAQHVQGLIALQKTLMSAQFESIIDARTIGKRTDKLLEQFENLAKDVVKDRKACGKKEKEESNGRKIKPLDFFLGVFIAPDATYSFLKKLFPKEDSVCLAAAITVSVIGGIYTTRNQIEDSWKAASIRLGKESIKETAKKFWADSLEGLRPNDIKSSYIVYYCKTCFAEKGKKVMTCMAKMRKHRSMDKNRKMHI